MKKKSKKPKTIDLRAASMFQVQSDGRVLAKYPPVVYIEPEDRVIIDNPFTDSEI